MEQLLPTVLIFTTAYLPFVGGAEIAVHELTARMPGRRYVLYTARLSRQVPAQETIGAVMVRRIGIGAPFLDKFLLAVLAPFLALREKKVSCVWAIMASYGGIAAYLYAAWLRPKSRLLLTVQEGDSPEHIRQRAGIFFFLVRRIFRRAHAVQAISTSLATWATQMGYEGKNLVVIPNGVDVERFTTISKKDRDQLRAKLAIAPDAHVVVTVSRLVAKNGVSDLLSAMELLPASYVLVCVGSGELEASLRAQARTLGNRVQFVGTIPHAQVPMYFAIGDVFCRASLSEGMGNVFLEAMAAGVPVVATRVGGIPDIVHDGQTGLLCPPSSPAALAHAIERVTTDAPLCAQLIAQGREMVGAYDWDRIAQRFDAFLQTICVS